jgi:pimeloyl-ACP methyl ester carboxylesterase
MHLARLFALVALLALTPLTARAQSSDPSGDWRGPLVVGAVNLRLGMHLGAASTIDSPDQGALGIPAQMTAAGRHVTLNVPSIGAVFEGDVSEDGAHLVGAWRQAGASFPLTLERGAYAALRRPQTPAAPFPYRDEEVGYDNPQRPGVHLAGTLTVPEGRGPFPAVLLITGSGAQDRNETLMGHQPFLVLADYLSRRGFAVLRVDDRGVGGSTGASPNDTSFDYATDVEAGVAFLRTRREIDHTRISLIGHSEGGLIAPMVAARDPRIASIVLWAGPGVRGADVLMEQLRASLHASGVSDEAIATAMTRQRAVMDALLAAPDAATARTALNNVFASIGQPPPEPQLNMLTSPWFRAFVAYDPAPTLRRLRMPVLALLGSKDVQVVATQNEPALRAALAGDRDASVIVLPGLNHLFQTAGSGAVSEYAQIEETIAPDALKTMGDWLVAHDRGRR